MKKKTIRGVGSPSLGDWRRYRPLEKGMQELVAQVAGGHTGLRWMLSHLAYILSPTKMRLFIESLEIGPPLAQRFERAKIKGDPVLAWRTFAMQEVRRLIKSGKPLAPQGCHIPDEERIERWKTIPGQKAQKKIYLHQALSAHYGDPVAIKAIRGVYCVGCLNVECDHHLVGPKKKQESDNVVPLAPPKRHLRLVASSNPR